MSETEEQWYYILVDDSIAGKVDSKEQAVKLGNFLSKKKTPGGSVRTLKIVDSEGETVEIFGSN